MTSVPELVALWGASGVGAGGGFFIIKWLFEYVGGRMDKRAAALDQGTQLLIEGLEKRLDTVTERLDRVERDLADCRYKHAESEAEVLRLKAMMQGAGDAREHAALIIAAEKQAGKDGK